MENTYPVVSSTWKSTLFHPFKSLETEGALSGSDTQAFRLFRSFLALKIALPFAFADGNYSHISFQSSLILLAVVLTALPRFSHLGLIAVAGFSFFQCWLSWPFTINHHVLESVIVILMFLVPEEEKQSSFSCAGMIKILMLSVWLFSGIHKLFDGYYLNGEFFALEALSNQTTLGHHLNQILRIFPSIPLACCTETALSVADWQAAIMLGLSWVTILAEIFLPIGLFIPKLRTLGIIGLFIFQAVIAYYSGEIDFAFTAFAVLFLFIPKFSSWSYPTLACFLLAVKPWL